MTTGAVIDFNAAKLARAPHEVGIARCVGCGLEATAVVPVDRQYGRGLECARCKRYLVTFVPH